MSQKSQVLVVDDDLAMCGFLRTFLGARNYNALTGTNADEAVRRFPGARPAAVLLDVVMPGSMDGLAALAAFKKIDKDVPIIVISGQGRTSVVVQAMRLGATDFLCKPFEENELEVVIEKALKQHQLSQEVATLRAQLKEQSRYTMLFGHSQQMTEVRDLIERVSDTDVTVLIRGESGVGKELVARALHEQSLRKDKPFVKVNCAALPTELLESELFGFEKGAFTGAIQHKPGKFEFANHGTMFLDEIGDMSFPLQAKLLQALQDGEFSRLGSEAAIVQELQQPSSPLHHWPPTTSSSIPRPTTPPLQPVMPPPAAAAAPVAVAAAPASVGMGSVAAVAAPAGASAPSNISLKDISRTAAREAERELILRMLTRTRWNRKEAAEILGISYKALLYKIKENGLDKAS